MVELRTSEEGTYAVINGKRHPLRFMGYDRYEHKPGCLANVPGNCCQCAAADRATMVYQADVTPKDRGL